MDRDAWSDLDRPPLRGAALQAALVRTPPWRELRVLDSTESTNAVVADEARAGADAGLVVVAEEQTGGRGRLDRSWESPVRAGLTLSMLLRPARQRADWPWVPLLLAASVAENLALHATVDATVKWPNDVLVDGRKVAGILAEVAGDAIVIGLGLNVSTRADELPVETATSLALAGGAPIDRGPLLLAILRGFGAAYAAWDDGSDDVVSEYRMRCSTLGVEVRVELPGGEVVAGRADDIDAAGGLVVGSRTITAGDVVHVRTSG